MELDVSQEESMSTRFEKRLGRGPLLTAIAAAPIAIVGVAAAVAEETPRYYYGPHMWEGGWWFLGPFSMFLFFAVAVAVVVLLVRWLGGAGPGNVGLAARQTPLDILRERFARGEIDKAEFDDRKKGLGG
ncbi:MAG: SHOCT domain-containing protein [Bauldia sp.]|nr:SHOCT domain-containing protein [Bauldia sp.]